MNTTTNYILSGLMSAYLAIAPVQAESRSVSDLIQESKARKEQMLEKKVDDYTPTKANTLLNPETPQNPKLDLSGIVTYNPAVNNNLEIYKFGPVDYLRAYNADTGKHGGDMFYLNFNKHLALYGFGSGGKWDVGPALSTTYKGWNLQLCLTGAEASLFVTKDGYGGGPINLKGNWQNNLEGILKYNAASFVIEKVAGKEARKKAQKAFSIYHLLKQPTPLTFGLQAIGALQAHRHDKGIKGVLKLLGHTLTGGLFHKDNKPEQKK